MVTGRQMAHEMACELMRAGASAEQAERAVLKAFAKLALQLKGPSAEVEARALEIACGGRP